MKYLGIIEKTKNGLDEKNVLVELKNDAQTLIQNNLQRDYSLFEDNIFFGYLAISIIIFGVILFFLLLYVIYRRDQRNQQRLDDLTKVLEQERMASIQSAKLASLGEMAAGLAHEINNPLAVIMGRVEILMDIMGKENASPLEINKNLGKIQEMSVRISKIVNSMRKVSKGNTSSELTSIRLGEVLEDILNLCSQRMKNKSIQLTYEPRDFDIMVKSNFTQLSQVIINIINNAIDELNKRSDDERKISITLGHHSDHLVLNISDSGEGIPANVREKLFQPFFTTTDVGQGTGLGLSISRSLMQDLGGSLTLAETKETCFQISIPRY